MKKQLLIKSLFRHSLIAVVLGAIQLSYTQAIASQDVSSEESNDARVQVTPVTVVKAVSQTLLATTNVRGQIEAATKPNIAAKVAAEVSDIYLIEGDSVKKGQILAALDAEAFIIDKEVANADITYLTVLIENQKKLLKRNQDLFNKKMISQAIIDDSETSLKQSNAQLLSAKAKLKKAIYKLSHTKIVSPINGIVQARLVSKGDYVKIGNDLYFIISTDDIYARLYFPETIADQIKLNMQVTLVRQKNGKVEKVNGTIERIRPMLAESNRALFTLINFTNRHQWRVGSSIQAEVILTEHKNAITVPKQTLVRRPNGTVVYKVVANTNKVVEQIVTTGLTKNDTIEILSGLTLNDVVVLDGAGWLTDGANIEIVEP